MKINYLNLIKVDLLKSFIRLHITEDLFSMNENIILKVKNKVAKLNSILEHKTILETVYNLKK